MHSLPIFARPALQRIVRHLCAEQPVSLVLVGGPLMGKSALLDYLAGELPAAAGSDLLVVQINCTQLSPGERPPLTPADGQRQIVLLDNFHGIAQWSADDRRVWIEWLASPQPGRGLLLASRRPLYEIGAEGALGSALPYFQQSFLGLIDGEEASRVVSSSLSLHPESEPLLPALLEWCGGHPFLLDRVAELLLDVAGMLPGGQAIGLAHLPLLRLRLAAAYGRLLFDSQWRVVEGNDDPADRPIAGLLRQLLRRGLRFDELSPAQSGPMNWLLVQGLMGIDGHNYRLFSPLLADYLALKLPQDPAAAPVVEPGRGAVHALVERESHRFTPQEKSLLLYFLDRPGVIVSVEELLAKVWQRPDGSARRVQEGIRRLRHRLVEFNGAVGTIDNEWGQGYRYVPLS
ncbi:MAG: helix-turn-helix domain-containing protein [Chloroflexi bacterium]|nr:helix-turn-helix domain-containing protein [Chloroflexota bacterium]